MRRILTTSLSVLFLITGLRITARAEVREHEGEGDAPQRRLEWFYGQRSYGGGIPEGARVKALHHAREMMSAKRRDVANRTASTVWQQTGPNNVGGRITSVAMDASSGVVFIGAAEGGVWRGVPGGSSYAWTPCTDKADALAIGALAIDPSDGNVVYAGTGEWGGSYGGTVVNGSPLYAGAGLMKSTDGGTTWASSGLTDVGYFSRIVVNPDNTEILWAATNRGLYRTQDAGATWTVLVKDSACSDMQLDPTDHTRLYVAVSGNGVYGVTDGDSSSFRRMNNGFPSVTGGTIGRISLGAAAAGNSTIVYAVVANNTSDFKGIYKYNGFSWATCGAIPGLFGGSGGQGWYDIVIAANPNDPSKVIVGGVDMYYSTNGGTAWTQSNIGHPDQHAIFFDPSGDGTVLVGNDGGIFVSGNNGASFQDVSEGLAITQFYGIDVEPSAGGSVYGGSQDNGSWKGSTPAGWAGLAGGDGGMTKLDPTNSIVYVEVIAGNPGGWLYRVRTDGGGSQIVFANNTTSDTVPWMRAIAVNRANGNVYLGTHRLYESIGAGGSFGVISPSLTRGTPGATVSAIGLLPSVSNLVWAGSNDGLVHVTSDGGTSWTNVTNNGLPGRAVTRILPISDKIAYVTESGFGPGHVLKTVDRGATWKDISSNLPDIPVNAIVQDPDNANHLFIGTDIGVLYTIDGGVSWVPYMEGLPNVVVTDLVLQGNTKQLYAGTYGRSTWSAPMDATVIALGSPVYNPLWFTNQTYPIVWYGVPSAKISYSTDNGTTWIAIDNNQSGPTYQWDVPSGITTTTALIKVENGTTTLISTPFSIRPPTKGDVLTSISKPFVPYGLSFDGHNLWSTSFYEHVIYKLDPDFLTVRETIPSPLGLDSCTGIVYNPDNHLLYVHRLYHDASNRPQNKIYQIDTLGALKKTFNSPAVYPTGLAYDGTSLYAVDRDSAKIFLLDADNGTSQAGYRDPVSGPLGPRGLAYIGNNEFLHVITVFNPGLIDTWMYRLEIGASGFRSTDTATLRYNGGLINARSIEKDPRYPNAYWLSDFGTGTSGSIYRIVGFDVQSLEVIAPATAAVWNAGSQHAITWTSKRIDSVMVQYTTDNGATWHDIAGPIPSTPATYAWTVPDIPSSTTCKIRVSGTGANGVRSTSGTFTIMNAGAKALQIQGILANEQWKIGSTHNISWTSNLITNVSLEYSLDSGVVWNPIAGPIEAAASPYLWTVPTVAPSTRCLVAASEAGGTGGVRSVSPVFAITPATLVGEKTQSPDGYVLYQNFPNPFNPSTEIVYSLPRVSRVTVQIYNADGQRVRTLVDGQQPSGIHRITVDAMSLPSGMYTYILRAGTTELSRSMLLTK